MDLLIATNTVSEEEADKAPATGTPGYATDGDPTTGSRRTIFPAYAWNAIQLELKKVIEAAGLTLNRNDNTQLYQAIQKVFSDPDGNYVRAVGAGDLQGGHKIYFGFNGTRIVGYVDVTEFGNIAFSNQFQSASSRINYAGSTAGRSITLNHNAPVPGTYVVQASVNIGAPPGATQPYMAALGVFFNGASNPVDSDTTPLSMSHALTIPAVMGGNTISCVYQPVATSGTWYPIGLSLSYLFVPS
ncbi:hypothetical protein [Acetobacter malorum]|uniref:hypothetical protein n=1 Tax=Acetobacter malorum TaxID=178901 RepID=UPI000777367A|nr:hypothetical protein [Acetobacter malorum]